METEDNYKAWENEHMTRGEVIELIAPIVKAVSILSTNQVKIANSQILSEDPAMVRAGYETLEIIKKSRNQLEDFRKIYERVLKEHGIPAEEDNDSKQN